MTPHGITNVGICCVADVTFSGSGSIVAVSYIELNGQEVIVKMFGYNEDKSWDKIGQDIIVSQRTSRSRYSIDLSYDGSVAAIGTIDIHSNIGRVQVYLLKESSWVSHEDEILNNVIKDSFGCSISLSNSGTLLAIGTYNPDNQQHGIVHIMMYNLGKWSHQGTVYYDAFINDTFRAAVSISGDATTLAVGSQCSSDQDGKVNVYIYNGSEWIERGNELMGSNVGDLFGFDVDLNKDGSILAVGTPYGKNERNDKPGYVNVYRYNHGSNSWIKLGDSIYGGPHSEQCGSSVELSGAGYKLILGCYLIEKHERISFLYRHVSNEWLEIESNVVNTSQDILRSTNAIHTQENVYTGFSSTDDYIYLEINEKLPLQKKDSSSMTVSSVFSVPNVIMKLSSLFIFVIVTHSNFYEFLSRQQRIHEEEQRNLTALPI